MARLQTENKYVEMIFKTNYTNVIISLNCILTTLLLAIIANKDRINTNKFAIFSFIF